MVGTLLTVPTMQILASLTSLENMQTSSRIGLTVGPTKGVYFRTSGRVGKTFENTRIGYERDTRI